MQEELFVAASGPEIRSLTKETVVKAPCMPVWSVWTTKKGIDSWWGPPDARIELRVGGPFELLFLPDAPEGEQGSEGCRFLAYVPGEMVAFTWNATPDHPLRREHTWVVITFLELDEDTTRVRLVHTGFLEGPDWDTYMAYFDDAWDRVLKRLAAHWENAD
jgi:uncharacterized protein YndB with AHSA1/START domain